MTSQEEVVDGMQSGEDIPRVDDATATPSLGGLEPELVEVRVAVAGAQSAQRIAGDLVARELVNNVHALGPMATIYSWEGKVHQTEEWLLLARTTTVALPDVTARVRQLHTYEVPEVIAIRVTNPGDGTAR